MYVNCAERAPVLACMCFGDTKERTGESVSVVQSNWTVSANILSGFGQRSQHHGEVVTSATDYDHGLRRDIRTHLCQCNAGNDIGISIYISTIASTRCVFSVIYRYALVCIINIIL